MNSLSWLLYGAEIAGNIKVAGGLGLIGAAVAGFVMPPRGVTCFSADHIPFSGFARRGVVVGLLVSAALVVFAPSRNAVMLIAASEVGETIVTSEQAQQIGGEAGALATDSLRVLRKFINDQLAEGEK